MNDLTKVTDHLTRKAMDKGREKAKNAFEANLATALKGGAGPAHKMTAVDHTLPPLRLIFEEETQGGTNTSQTLSR